MADLDTIATLNSAEKVELPIGSGSPVDSPPKPVTSQPMTPLQKQKVADLRWAASAPEVQQHKGKYVIVHQKRVVAVGLDEPTLLAEAARIEQCPWWHLVVEVVPADEFWEVRA